MRCSRFLLKLCLLLALALPGAAGCVRAGFAPPRDGATDGDAGPVADARPGDSTASEDLSGEETSKDAATPKPPVAAWAIRIGGSGMDQANGLAVDSSGRVFVTGSYTDTMNLGTKAHVSNGTTDIFLAAFSAQGLPVWSKSYGGPSPDKGVDVAVDPNGAVTIVGSISSAVTIDGKPVTHLGFRDILAASFTNNGVIRWATGVGGPKEDFVSAVTIGAANAACIVGKYTGSMPAQGFFSYTDGEPDAFFLCLNAAQGQTTGQAKRTFLAEGSDAANSITAAANGDLFFTGSFTKGIFLGGPKVHMAAGNSDVFWAQMSSDGAYKGSHSFGAAANEGGTAVALFGGKVAVAGPFTSTMTVGSTTLIPKGGVDGFVATFSAGGTPGWVAQIGGMGDETMASLAADAAGNLYIAGHFTDTLDFDAGKATSKGGWDAFVASFTPDGKPRWLLPMGGAGHDVIRELAVDSTGNIYVAGHFTGVADLAGKTLTAQGQLDGFVVKLTP